MPTPSRRRGARTLGVLSVLLAVVLGTASGAHAASKTVRDATGDVYSLTEEAPTKVAGRDGDITSVTTSHRARVVVIKVRAHHLSLDQTLLFAKVRTRPTGPAYFFNGTADIGIRMAIITRGQAQMLRCPGIRMDFRPTHGYVAAVIPRTCLGSPRWVQAGAALATTDSMIGAPDDFDPFGGGTSSGTFDIAGLGDLTVAQVNATAPPLPLGPRVRAR
jgi:hypothetical protein